MDKAVAEGIIPAGKNPDAAISRLEFCQSAAKALGLAASDKASPFTDTADGSVIALNEKGIIDGVGNGLFAPDKTLTRAQISKIIYLIRNMEA
jgi:hypothetical protein